MRARELESTKPSIAGIGIALVPIRGRCLIPVEFVHANEPPDINVSCRGSPVLCLTVDLGGHTSDRNWVNATFTGTACIATSNGINGALWQVREDLSVTVNGPGGGQCQQAEVGFESIATLVRPDGRVIQLEGIDRIEKLDPPPLGHTR